MRFKEKERPKHGAKVTIPGTGECVITNYSKKSRVFRYLAPDGMLHSVSESELYLKIGVQ
jgi:hypothetical protein